MSDDGRRRTIAAIALVLLVAGGLRSASAELPSGADAARRAFSIESGGLVLGFDFFQGRLRSRTVLPAGAKAPSLPPMVEKSDLETAIQCSGGNRIDQTAAGGDPGYRLEFVAARREPTPGGERVVFVQRDGAREIEVESIYEFFTGVPVVRRHTRVTNRGQREVGIEYVSSALLNNFAQAQDPRFDERWRFHWATNRWTAEAQWRASRPSELGWASRGGVRNGRVELCSLGSMSTGEYLPVGLVEDAEAGLTWFWQIEPLGAWRWEAFEPDHGHGGTTLYLGGADEERHHAFERLAPGESYETVPAALGCVRGGLDAAAAALTRYRRVALRPRSQADEGLPVIFNDYMNCLGGDPTTEELLPVIDAAGEAGAEYFVVDAGWYAEKDELWWDTIGLWEPSRTRFPGGLGEVFDRIRARGMKPGLWLEIELAGIRSPLAARPDDWFFEEHGRRVVEGSRHFLDFRNPAVRDFADGVVDRLVRDYGIRYVKKDYNCSARRGTERAADSAGQGLVEATRAHLRFIDGLRERHPGLLLENCSGGGMRMDYGMLSHFDLQSSSDQGDYRKYPGILVGEMLAVLPEQLAAWSYPLADGDAAEASFNMVTALSSRIHLSGQIARLAPESRRQVATALALYKSALRSRLARAVPFFPLGLPSVADDVSPVALGMRADAVAHVSVWRLTGPETVRLRLAAPRGVRLLYPTDLGIRVTTEAGGIEVRFPKPYMAALLEVAE